MVLVKTTPETNPTRISVFMRIYCGIPSEVICFSKIGRRWKVLNSMDMPSDVKKAARVKEGFDAGFEELRKVIEQENSLET